MATNEEGTKVVLKRAVVLPLLQAAAKFRTPQDDLVAKFIAIDEMQTGEISLTAPGSTRVVNWSERGKAVVDILQGELGITCQPSVDDDHRGDALAWMERQRPEGAWEWDGLGAAPWYINWRVDSELVEPVVRPCLRAVVGWQEKSDSFLFRGEDALYPRILSGFARKWNTTHAPAIESIATASLREAKLFVKGANVDSDDEGLWATIQHKGGVTNKVDFSRNIWIALYFAAQGDPNQSGRLWALDVRKATEAGVVITDAQRAFDPAARQRAVNQRGVLAESKSGKISSEVLREVARFPGAGKDALRDFLGEIGVTEVALFADIDAFIANGQEHIPLEGLVVLWLDLVRKGEWKRVLAEARALASTPSDDQDRKTAGFYCGALAAARGGDVKLAWEFIRQARYAFGNRKVPQIMKRNLDALREAARSGNSKRLAQRLDLMPFDELWSLQLTGYTFKGTASLDEAAKTWADRQTRNPVAGKPRKSSGWFSRRQTK